jgi:RNA polymerase sigma-70 factor (ECF subfamily)
MIAVDTQGLVAVNTTRSSLLLRIKDQDDSAAWSEFDAIYRPMLLGFARARGLEEVDAEDVAQQCLAAISTHIERFDYDPSKGRFKSWLRTVVNNQVRDRLRTLQPRLVEASDTQGLADAGPTPDELFDRIWMKSHLRHCLAQVRSEVTDSTFQAFQDYVIDEQPIAEVCRRLGMTRNQVQLIKWRVTQKLSEKMRELLGDEE